MATREIPWNQAVGLDPLFSHSLDGLVDDDIQMLDLPSQTLDRMTAGEPSVVRDQVFFGQDPLSDNNLEPAMHSSLYLNAPFNEPTQVFDACWPTSEVLAGAGLPHGQGHLHSSLGDAVSNVNEQSDAADLTRGLNAGRHYEPQSNPTAYLPIGRFSTDIHETRIDDRVMLDALPSLSIVGNDGRISDSHTHQAPLAMQYRQNTSSRSSFMEVPIARTSLTNANDLVGPDMDVQKLAPRQRTRYATAEDWEKYRSEIAKLYYDDNNTLSGVQAIMKAQYGFNASLDMYKKRISKWPLHKNCKTAEKEAILQCMDTQKSLGVDLGQPLLNGKRVKLHLIDRHRKQKRKAEYLASDDKPLGPEISSDNYQANERKNLGMMNSADESSANAKRARTQRPASTIVVSFSRITDPTEYRSTQDLLLQVDHYIDAKLDRDPHVSIKAWEKSATLPGGAIHISYLFQDETFTCRFYDGWDLFERFRTTYKCLETGQVRSAWKLASEGAAMVRACLQQQSPKLLRRLLTFSSAGYWSMYPEIQNQLLRQFSAMAMTILGQDHPITNVCRLLQSIGNRLEIALLALRKTLDALERRLGSNHQVCLETRMRLCKALAEQRRYDEAGRAMQQLVATSRQLEGRSDPESRQHVFELAGLYYDLGKDDNSENILVRVVERGIEMGHLGGVNVIANEIRGRICDSRGNLDAAESLMWTALSGSLLSYGPHHPLTAQIWVCYKRIEYKRQNSTGLQAKTFEVPRVDSKVEQVRCFSRPRSWSFPLEKPVLRIATKNVEGRRNNRSRKRLDSVRTF